MNQSARILVAGLGSAHGDDQAGWLVAENLASQCQGSQEITVRKASIPLDVLDWLEGIDILHVCDACEATPGHGNVHRLELIGGQIIRLDRNPNPEMHTTLQSLRSRGSHDFGLPDVLRLAAEIKQLPKQVIVWGIAGTDFQPRAETTAETISAASQAVMEILKELGKCHA
jgi:hydrogenase maturation protease